jgi:DNA-binding SARP family transcriptional activator/tetratricopeptide (TPR) repeat protein
MSDHGIGDVRFEVLGAVRAWRGRTQLDLGSLQQRVMLAVLLLHANRPVARERLIDAVWGADVPACAVNLVQRHVSSLRRVLDPQRLERTTSRLLRWTDAGYVLAVPANGLDLEKFDAELTAARAARAAGDLPGAAAALATALRLWHGSPFAGLASPLLDAQRDSLSERWISATEERIEVDLALGNHADLVAELRNLIADHPMRERLRQLLMLALYRSDRQAEALSAYHDARTYLLDELGIEPAEPMQRLHQQILAADPSLARPREASAPPGKDPALAGRWQLAPAQLPHGLAHFTGRGAELAQLEGIAADARGGSVLIIAITGPAGVGKTTLAVHWAHQVSKRFPDGQLYVNLRGFDPVGPVMEPGEAIRGFLEALGLPADRVPNSLDGQAALYRSALAGRRVLVVLDNARDADHVRSLLPGSPGCVVVVTSRNQLGSLIAADGARPVMVDLMTVPEARQMLARRLGRDCTAAEPLAVDNIIESCARLPLALAIVAARAAARPGFALALMADELRTLRGGLSAFDGGDPTTNARAAFSWSYQMLSSEAARLFRLLSLHPGPDLAIEAAASLAGADVGWPSPAMAELIRAHLVTERSPGRFTFHDLLRAYAAEKANSLDSDADRQAAIHRMRSHYLHGAYAATRLLDPHRNPVTIAPMAPGATRIRLADAGDALNWFVTEHSALLAMTEPAAAGLEDHIWQLAWTLETFHDRLGLWHDSAATQRAGLDAAERIGDRTGQAIACRSIARAYAQLGRCDEARPYLHRALDLFADLGHLTGQANAHFTFARVAFRQGSHEEALSHAQLALAFYRAAGHEAGEAYALGAVGWFHILLGDPDQALSYCQQALGRHRDLADRQGEASALDSLGYAHHHLGRHDQAVTCYKHAISLWRELGDRYNEADTLTHLGDAYHADGQASSGHQAWLDALTILDDLGHSDAAQVQARLKAANGAVSMTMRPAIALPS